MVIVPTTNHCIAAKCTCARKCTSINHFVLKRSVCSTHGLFCFVFFCILIVHTSCRLSHLCDLYRGIIYPVQIDDNCYRCPPATLLNRHVRKSYPNQIVPKSISPNFFSVKYMSFTYFQQMPLFSCLILY